MKEAMVECLIREFPIHDLGLRLRQGQVEYVAAEEARSSQDLVRAVQIGAVRVRYVQRAQMVRKATPPRPPPPPNVRLPRQRATATPDPAPAPADMAEAVARQVKVEIDKMKGELLAALAARPAVVVAGPASTPTVTPVKGSAADEPVFIPERIVNKDAELTLKSESTEAGGLDDAASALKKTRGRRKKE